MIKTILGFPNYTVNTVGHIYSVKHNKLLKPVVNKGYMCVCLYRDNKKYKKDVHRLVLETFVGKRPEGMESIHKNGNKEDNKLSNLKWGTHTENMRDKKKHGTNNYACGEKHYRAKLTERDVLEIRRLWWDVMYSVKDIAEIYGVHYSNIHQIIDRKIWKHI